MQRTGKYTKDDPMSDLVSDNYRILLLMSRFGIGLGFGESSIGEVCRANGVDTSTFLIVTNMMLYDEIPADAYDKVSSPTCTTRTTTFSDSACRPSGRNSLRRWGRAATFRGPS